MVVLAFVAFNDGEVVVPIVPILVGGICTVGANSVVAKNEEGFIAPGVIAAVDADVEKEEKGKPLPLLEGVVASGSEVVVGEEVLSKLPLPRSPVESVLSNCVIVVDDTAETPVNDDCCVVRRRRRKLVGVVLLIPGNAEGAGGIGLLIVVGWAEPNSSHNYFYLVFPLTKKYTNCQSNFYFLCPILFGRLYSTLSFFTNMLLR